MAKEGYTPAQLARISGVSVRTLHHYDQIGLLVPARRKNGYRTYTSADAARLQQILLYRDMGLELGDIAQLLDSPGYDAASTLRSHLAALRARRTQLDTLIATVEKTVASIHGQDFLRGATSSQVTDMYLRALEVPKVLTLGHIDRTEAGFDVDAVVSAARDGHRLIEINEESLARPASAERCRCVVERCAELGCPVVVNSDTHIAYKIGRFTRALALLDELQFPEELVANRTAASFHEALAAAGLEIEI